MSTSKAESEFKERECRCSGQTVYTDAHAYSMHVALFVYVFTCSLLSGMTFNLFTLF